MGPNVSSSAPGRTRATLVRAAEAVLDILFPPGNLHAPAGYRKHVAGVLLRRAVAEAEAFERAVAWRGG
jgi:CO/xanthine dehydrogenase FAD-binding subunit